MNTMTVACESCAGMGYITRWVIDYGSDSNTAHREEVFCHACNGKGYTEHAIFSVEEAKAILKHCGLSDN